MIKIVGIIIATLFCVLVLRQYNKTFSVILSVCCCIIAFLYLTDKLSYIFSSITAIAADIPQSLPYIKMMFKVLCIILVSQFVCDLCRDNGENALANIMEIGAKLIVVVIILPLFETVISIVSGLVK